MSYRRYGLHALYAVASIVQGAAFADVDGGALPLYRFDLQHPSAVSMSVGFDTVFSEVAYEPHQSTGGFAPVENEPRYQSGRLGLSWSPSAKLDINIDWATRTIASKRDQYTLDSYQLSMRYALPEIIKFWSFAVGASIGSNRAKNLTKTSFTNFDEYLVTRANLNQPSDEQVQTNIFAMRSYGSFNTVTYIGAGQAISENNGFSGVVQDSDNCRYDISVNNNNSAVQLIEPCGSVQRYRQEFQSRTAFEQEYNFGADDDVTGKTRYWQAGAQLSRHTGREHYGIGYHYQRFYRGIIDERLASRGMTALNSNHSVSGWWHHRLNTNWQLEAGAQYSLRPMLNKLFVLYTGYTSERFRKDAVLFSLTLRYRFGR